MFYGAQMPIQNILAMEIGFTVPIIHSFRKLLPPRRLREVYIWQGDTLLSEAERIGVQEIFESRGINVRVSEHFRSTKDDFLRNYTDPTYDLVWVLCHGQYFHYEPHKSYLDLGSDIIITIEDFLAQAIPHEERRLLIVDACDGATTSLTNSPLSIGIGAAVTGMAQSLFSHGWPVDNYSSLIAGLLLATYLSEGRSYASSHFSSVSLMAKGKAAILEVITQHCKNPEILDRIENKDMDYSDFLHWGSLLYMV
jgi:hypothetical protein